MKSAADTIIDDLAARQHGVVSRAQLVDAGVPAHVITHRRTIGRLVPLHQGVSQVGPVATPRAPFMAALLACGPRAVLSHESAAVLWGIRPQSRPGEPIDVTVPSGYRNRRGIRLHRPSSLPRHDIRRLDGLRATAPDRTLLDLAATLEGRPLERAVVEAFARGLVRRPRLLRRIAERPGAAGSARLREILDAGRGVTRSEAEKRFLALVAQAGLPEPLINSMVEGLEVDFLWPAERLIVEVDGYAFHSTTSRVDNDHRRDTVLTTAGFAVLRFTWSQITRESLASMIALDRLLRQRRDSGARKR